ncbi:hypothetical protein Ddc_09778 [Ditylenchus destructor]|nr:hypothetical protein Ddc_09778 [Ditylenchus destructor]
MDDSVDDRPRPITVQEYGTSGAGSALEEKDRLERVNEMTEREGDSSGSENATPAAKKLRIRDDFRYRRSAEENETPEPTEPERKFRIKTDLRYKRSDEENETPEPTEPDTKLGRRV